MQWRQDWRQRGADDDDITQAWIAAEEQAAKAAEEAAAAEAAEEAAAKAAEEAAAAEAAEEAAAKAVEEAAAAKAAQEAAAKAAEEAAASCNDGHMNADELGVDCGGHCKYTPCGTCDDGWWNNEEIGTDCGGPHCPPCPDCPRECMGDICTAPPDYYYYTQGVPEKAGEGADAVGFCNTVCFQGEQAAGVGCHSQANVDRGALSGRLGQPPGATYRNRGARGNKRHDCSLCTTQDALAFKHAAEDPLGPACRDGVKNGDEVGVDCGGSCSWISCLNCDALECPMTDDPYTHHKRTVWTGPSYEKKSGVESTPAGNTFAARFWAPDVVATCCDLA